MGEQLSPEQDGFRSGRSCCGQVLNLTQYVQDGYKNRMITGAVFVHLTAAYDTVKHWTLLLKLATIVKNTTIVRVMESLLTNQILFIGKEWQTQSLEISEEWSTSGVGVDANAIQHLY